MRTEKAFDTRYSVFTASILLLAFIMSISFIPRYLETDNGTMYKAGKSASSAPDLTQPDGLDVFPPIPPEEDIHYAILGTVLSINAGTQMLNVHTIYGNRNVERTPETQYFIQEWPNNIERRTLTTEELALFFSQNTPSIDSIKPGDTIISQSTRNISGLNQFTASRIIIIK